MPEESAPSTKKKRAPRRAPSAAPLPVLATVTIKGHREPMEIACLDMRQVGAFWVFTAPSPVPGMFRVTRIAVDQIAMLETDQWPDRSLFQEAPREAQAPQGATQAPTQPSGLRIEMNPVLERMRLGPNGSGESGFRGISAGSTLSSAPPGGAIADFSAS